VHQEPTVHEEDPSITPSSAMLNGFQARSASPMMV